MSRIFAAFSLLVVVAACRQPVSDDCQTYISCQAAYDDALGLERVDTERFSDTGDCWTHPDVADDCTSICLAQVAALAAAGEDAELTLPECE